jgi:hypothetical protein
MRGGWLQELALDLLKALTASRGVNIVTVVDMENPG